MLRLRLSCKRALLSLATLVSASVISFFAWWFWFPTGHWQERHGTLAAVTRVEYTELNKASGETVERLRGFSTSGLEVELRFRWKRSPEKSRATTPVALWVRFADDSWPTFEDVKEGELWVSVESPLKQGKTPLLHQRWDALDGAPTVALALDVLERRLQELGAPPLGAVVVAGTWTEEALAAHAGAYDPRITQTILVEPPGDEALWGFLMRRTGCLTPERSLRRFEARGGSSSRLNGFAFDEMERRAASTLAKPTSPH